METNITQQGVYTISVDEKTVSTLFDLIFTYSKYIVAETIKVTNVYRNQIKKNYNTKKMYIFNSSGIKMRITENSKYTDLPLKF